MKIKFNDFRKGINLKNSDNLVGLSEAKVCYNFDFSSGSLKTSFPFQACFDSFLTESDVSEEFVEGGSRLSGGAIFYFKKYDFENQKDASKLILVTPKLNTFYLSLSDLGAKFQPLGIKFTSLPGAINYRLDSEDVIIFSSESDNMVVWDGANEPEIVVDAPKISSMCLHGERLFATTEGGMNEVWFSDDLDPTNWSVSLVDAGFIQLADERGKPLKVVSFNGYVYIFREMGISRLSASGAQEEFFLSHLFVSSGKIYDKTICLCGDKIVFLASDGIYSFNGTETTKILADLSNMIMPAPNSKAVFFDGKYYLSAHVDFEDGGFEDEQILNNALFVLDTTTGEYALYRGISVASMAVTENENNHQLVFLNDSFENTNNLFVEVCSERKTSPLSNYETGLYDFGDPSKLKTFRKVVVYKKGNGSVNLKIFNESGKVINVQLKENFSQSPVLISGKAFGFKVEAVGDAEIENIIFDIY